MSDLEADGPGVDERAHPDAVRAVMGMFEPQLLVTEDKHLFLACRASIIATLNPCDTVEAVLVMRYFQCCWSIERFRRVGTGLINLAHKLAIGEVLREYLGDGLEGLALDAVVEKWFTDPAIKKRAIDHLARFAIDESAIGAQAMAMRLPELVQIEEMLARTEAQALWLLRELDRRRDAAARRAALRSGAGHAGEIKLISPPEAGGASAPRQQ